MAATDPNYVQIFDTTLRDGEQSPGASMNVEEGKGARQSNLSDIEKAQRALDKRKEAEEARLKAGRASGERAAPRTVPSHLRLL